MACELKITATRSTSIVPISISRTISCFLLFRRSLYIIFFFKSKMSFRMNIWREKRFSFLSHETNFNKLFFHFFFFQQLFRSQNPNLASNAGVPQPGPTAQQQLQQTLPLPSQQYLAQQNAAYAAQQPTPYVINPGQDATQYMGLIPGKLLLNSSSVFFLFFSFR